MFSHIEEIIKDMHFTHTHNQIRTHTHTIHHRFGFCFYMVYASSNRHISTQCHAWNAKYMRHISNVVDVFLQQSTSYSYLIRQFLCGMRTIFGKIHFLIHANTHKFDFVKSQSSNNSNIQLFKHFENALPCDLGDIVWGSHFRNN